MMFVFMLDLKFYCYFINFMCDRLIFISFRYFSLCFATKFLFFTSVISEPNKYNMNSYDI